MLIGPNKENGLFNQADRIRHDSHYLAGQTRHRRMY